MTFAAIAVILPDENASPAPTQEEPPMAKRVEWYYHRKG